MPPLPSLPMIIRRRLLCLSALFACAAPAPASRSAPPSDATPDIRAEIQAADEAWSAADIAGDTAAMRALYTEDVVSMQSGGADIVGQDAMVTDLGRGFATRTDTILRIVTEINSLDASGDLAWEVGNVTLTRRPRDSTAVTPRSARFKYITFWRRGADGRWRIRRDLGVPDALPPR